mgnify:CR=1 FL=1
MPIAVGLAMAIERKSDPDRRVWAFIGDMAWASGITHDSVQYARNFNLPLNVVVECNRLSVNTPTDVVWGSHHDHNPDRGIFTLIKWRKGEVMQYCYERTVPHMNSGAFVTFQ